jgi:hypothetical protein
MSTQQRTLADAADATGPDREGRPADVDDRPHPSDVHREYDVETVPDAVPTDAERADIMLANQLLRDVRQHEFGHHDPARRAFVNWAKEQADDPDGPTDINRDDPIVRAAYDIGVNEFATRNLETIEHAEAVLEWGRAEYPDRLAGATETLNDRLRDKLESQVEEEEKQAEAERFAEDPPETVNGWERFESDKPDVILAYRGENHGTPSVAAVYETEAGELDRHESTLSEWNDADTAAESKVNRHFAVPDRDDPDPFRDLLNHLRTFDAEPIAVTDGGQDADGFDPSEHANETVRLVVCLPGKMSPPAIIEGETSGSGKTIAVDGDQDALAGDVRLDTEAILSGESEVRSPVLYELYQPADFQQLQRSNYAPGPQVGVNELTDGADLPEPTHRPQEVGA